MNDIRLTVTKSGWKSHIAGHPWIFKNDLIDLPEIEAGSVVSLKDWQGKHLGQGFYNPQSNIAFRLITYGEETVDPAFWRQRLNEAVAYREGLGLKSNARRLVFSEADGLPGLIVDDYAGNLVIQILTLGMENRRDLLLELINERLAPSAVVMRNDVPVRKLEGLDKEKGLVSGNLPDRVEIQEEDLFFSVDLLNGQKTGAYLDQRDNRILLRDYAAGKKALDVCCYEGWFSLHLAKAGASRVVALDSSRPALEQVNANAARNGLSEIETRKANCFDALKEMSRGEERFDLIVLDPPPFARRRGDIKNALRAYKDLNQRAILCLNPGGVLLTCCCSHGVSQDRFAGAVVAGAGGTRRRLLLLEQRLQPLDHPILFNEPESLYLKAIIFRCL